MTQQQYLATRAHYPRVPAYEVLEALRTIRLDLPRTHAFKVRNYKPDRAYNPRMKDSRGRLTERRWIEDTARAGLRFVGYADEIAKHIQHTGWYTDEFHDTLYRGSVWQLPSRNGCALYVAGYSDPNNKGAALIDFDTIPGERGADTFHDKRGDARDAAMRADAIARDDAETEREYQAKANAAIQLEGLREDLKHARKWHTQAVRGIASGIGDDATGAHAFARPLVRWIRKGVNREQAYPRTLGRPSAMGRLSRSGDSRGPGEHRGLAHQRHERARRRSQRALDSGRARLVRGTSPACGLPGLKPGRIGA